MFVGVSSFNDDLSNWDVSNVTDMGYMSLDTSSFNLGIDNWNVSNVTDMSFMFLGASEFNQDLSGWCVSQIPFRLSEFDTDVTRWIETIHILGTCSDKKS